jgi:hypothetical protein
MPTAAKRSFVRVAGADVHSRAHSVAEAPRSRAQRELSVGDAARREAGPYRSSARGPAPFLSWTDCREPNGRGGEDGLVRANSLDAENYQLEVERVSAWMPAMPLNLGDLSTPILGYYLYEAEEES